MSLFSLEGRIGRMHFLLLSVIPLLISMVMISLSIVAAEPSSHGILKMSSLIFPGAVIAFNAFLLLWISIVTQVQRFHDLGQSGWLVLLNLIPGASFLIWLVLLLAAGQTMDNVYGPARYST